MVQTRKLHVKSPGSASLALPGGAPWHVGLNDPAKSVMTDFNERGMVTLEGSFPIDKALEIMKHAGVRAAFVVGGPENKIVGIITAYDILGEKPLRHMQAMGCSHNSCNRDDVMVQDIMDPVADWQVVDFKELEEATVATVMDALNANGRTHLAVVEYREGQDSRLRGIFSSAKLLRLTAHSRKAAA
jgi:CBS domain-containing protein